MTFLPLPSCNVRVLPEWIDHNGHMNVAYYVLAFDQATDQFYEQLGLGLDYESSGSSVFTTGMNVNYLQEMFSGERGIVTTQLLDVDRKRLHYIHQLHRPDGSQLIATNECLAVNVDLTLRRSAPFPDTIYRQLQEMLQAHQTVSPPAQVGRRLEIRR